MNIFYDYNESFFSAYLACVHYVAEHFLKKKYHAAYL